MAGIPDDFDLTDSFGYYGSAGADGPVGGEDEFDLAFRAPGSQPSDGEPGPSSSSHPSFGGDDQWANYNPYAGPSARRSSDQYEEPDPLSSSYAPLSYGKGDLGAQSNPHTEPPLSYGGHAPWAAHNPFKRVLPENYADPGEGREAPPLPNAPGGLDPYPPADFQSEPIVSAADLARDLPEQSSHSPLTSSGLGPADVPLTRSRRNPFRGAEQAMILPSATSKSGESYVHRSQPLEPAPADAVEGEGNRRSPITWTQNGRDWVGRQQQAGRRRPDVILQFSNDMKKHDVSMGTTKVYNLFKDVWPREE